MTEPNDWGDLKSGWQSAPLDPAFTARVRYSLEWRIWLSRAWFASEMLSAALLVLLTVQNLATGNLATAGFLALIGGACAAGLWWARRVHLDGNTESLRGMVVLAVSRARRAQRLVIGSYAVLLLLLAATLSRQDEYLAAHLTWLSVSAVIAAVIHVSTWMRLRRFTAIRRSLFGGER